MLVPSPGFGMNTSCLMTIMTTKATPAKANTLYTRQKEHFKGFEKRKEDNPMWKHKELHDPNTQPKFQFKVEKFCATPIDRTIYERVSINHCPSTQGHLMNSKTEYKQGQVARVVLVRGLGQ